MRSTRFPLPSILRGLLVALVTALPGCGGGGGGGISGGDQPDFSVVLTMRGTNGAETSTFAFGKSIVFDVTVTNRSGGTQVLSLPTTQIYDLVVFPEGSQTPAFRWSFNRVFSPTVTNLTFNGHQSITYLYVWPGVLDNGTQIMPGDYDVRATLAFSGYSSDWGAHDELGAAPRKITVTD